MVKTLTQASFSKSTSPYEEDDGENIQHKQASIDPQTTIAPVAKEDEQAEAEATGDKQQQATLQKQQAT